MRYVASAMFLPAPPGEGAPNPDPWYELFPSRAVYQSQRWPRERGIRVDINAETTQRRVRVGYVGSLVYLLVLCCNRILLGSVLDLIKVERENAYEFPTSFGLSFSRELPIRGNNLTTWELGVTRTLRKRKSVTYQSMKCS
jgi:hypothetical protein